MYLVQKISTFEGLEIINPQIYSQYKDARRDVLSRLGEIFMDAYLDSDKGERGCFRDIRTGFEIFPNFYIEDKEGNEVDSLPESAEQFKSRGEDITIYVGSGSDEFISIRTIGRVDY